MRSLKNLHLSWHHPRYHAIETIGVGSTGEVFRTHDRYTDTMVALKRLRCPVDDSIRSLDTQRLQLAHDFAVLESINHPNIIRVLDYGFDDLSHPFLVMELFERGISTYQANYMLSWPERVELIIQILHALSYLHNRGILHRDLNPGNVLFSVFSRGVCAKLLDFGQLFHRLEDSSLRGSAVGSVGYLAPEVHRGKAASSASDLFAVGVLAHELLLGQHPLADRPMFDRFLGHWNEASIFRSNATDDLDLCRVLRRALCCDPALRYCDAMQFADDLTQATMRRISSGMTIKRASFF